MMNSASMMAIQPELASGESVLWAGQPNPRIIFHKEDIYMIPFSLLWGGFAIFWEAAVTGFWGTSRSAHSAPLFMMLWGIPFVVIGQYLIWGRFFYAAWLKKRTHYAVTDRRVIVVQDGWKRQMASAYIDALPTISREGRKDGSGTLRFAEAQRGFSFSGSSNRSASRGWDAWNSLAVGASPLFLDIEDIDSVYRLVCDLHEKSRSARSS